MIQMRRYAFVILSLAMIAILLSSSCAQLRQIKSSITGTVYMDGRPIQGTVQLLDENGAVLGSSRTNMNGHYQIRDVQPGTYILQFLNMQGMPYGNEVTVLVRMGRPEVVDLELTQADRVPLN